MKLDIPDDGTVLFIGDSITDCQRDRDIPVSLGRGYVSMAAGRYAAEHLSSQVRFVNRGISGDTTEQLRERWAEDCLAVGADLVSVLIGINDAWRRSDGEGVTPIGVYESRYRSMLAEVADGGAKLVLIEPFLIPVAEPMLIRREDVDAQIAVVRGLAAEFGAVLVPADGVMARAAVAGGGAKWSDDGVHLTAAGHALLTGAWLDAVGAPR